MKVWPVPTLTPPDAFPFIRLQTLLTRRFVLLMTMLASLLLLISMCLLVLFTHLADKALMQAEADKATLLLASERERLQVLAKDYASWDDTYHYVNHPDRRFIETNFSSSYHGFGVDFTAIFRRSGELLYIVGDGSRPLSPALLQALSAPAIQSQKLAAGESINQLVFIGSRPAQLALAGVSTSDESAPSNGMIVMGRYLDGTNMARLGAQAGLDVALGQGGEEARADYGWDGRVDYRLARALADAPGWSLQLNKQLDHRMLLWLSLFFACSIVLLIAIASWWMRHFLRELVISRIEQFARLARAGDGGETLHWPVTGRCELDDLALAYNRQMDELAKMREKLQQQAVTDPLTRLGNRWALEQALADMARRRDGQVYSLLLLDLDGFKRINDSLGHLVGDQLLQALTVLLHRALDGRGTLFRSGGDEFCALIAGDAATLSVHVTQRLLPVLRRPLIVGSHELKVTASIGLASWQAGMEGQALMRHADLAMYAAKQQGRDGLCVYSQEMSAAADERLLQEQALRSAVANDEIRPWFQPVVDAVSGQVVSLEMLARWSLNGRMVPPPAFIQLAEEIGLIGTLWEQMLRRALVDFCAFRALQPALKLQVNLSALQLLEENLATRLQALIVAHGLPVDAVSIEITESATLDELPLAGQTLAELVGIGIGLHLDDFGTGYSSMARLCALPFDTLKLDRSFVQLLGAGDDTLARTVYDMAQGMGLALIAEGVETVAEYRQLRAIGYRQIQGYLFARPMDGVAMLAWLGEPHDWAALERPVAAV
ncbi:EAL domain-containing protein [Craterilacuibacter sp. RT1T]|uniref:putative bifunctional diguanylate cyclase/phosphodiesterase n=1 Tax=Craterilacuibacter sp. RT1T TaxID=2942211 RepID=UPI0020C020DB|nr:EAL domain-containing protein [Craterilacuibacter sp. RT1T]MCL6264506.1 EAL domain-containing protein [Craterilacuibacter sp. RT1T]